jgi:phage terminase small subunit
VEQSGRKSADSLSVVVVMPGQRPEPPPSLGDAEAAIWRQVVSCHPHDWFIASTHVLLIGYCEAWVKHREFSEELAKLSLSNPDDRKWYAQVMRMRDAVTSELCRVGTKLRITPHAMRSEREAATGVRKTMQTGRKPWETVDQG